MKNRFLIAMCALMALSPLAAKGGNEKGGSDELTELHYLGGNSNFDLASDTTAVKLEEMFGPKFIAQMLPAGDSGTQKLMLKLASGDRIDLAVTSAKDFQEAVKGGAVMDLTSLLEQYGDEIKGAINDNTWEAVKFDGKIMGIPYASEQTGGVLEGVLVRMDLLKSVDKKMPTTVAEMKDVAMALKAKYPEMYPLTTSLDQKSNLGYWLPFVQISSGFGLSTEWVEENGKLIPSIKQDGMRQYLSYLNDLYKKDLIDPEFPAHNRETRNTRFLKGGSAMTKVHWWDGLSLAESFRSTGSDIDFAYMAPLKDNKGMQSVEQISSVGKVAFIPKTTANAAAVVKWVNDFMKVENFTKVYLGTEGETYEKRADGYYPIQPAFNEKQATGYWYIPASIEKDNLSMKMWGARLKKNDDLVWGWEDLQTSSKSFSLADPTAFAPPMTEVSENREALRQFVKDKMTSFIIDGFSSSDYQAFLAEWENRGGSAMETAYNNWFVK